MLVKSASHRPTFILEEIGVNYNIERHSGTLSFSIFLMLLASVVSARVSTTGAIRGIIQDTSGAVVPHALATIRHLGPVEARNKIVGIEREARRQLK